MRSGNMFNLRIGIKLFLALQLFLITLWAGVRVADSAPLRPAPSLQGSDIYTLDITFKQMGFEEHTLNGPYDLLSHELVIPDGWQIQPASYLELDMTYISNIILKNTQDERYAILDILLDEQLLAQHLIQEPADQPFRLRVALPPDLLNQPEQRKHDLVIRLDSSYICVVEHRYDLTILPDSRFHLEYRQLPATPELRIYPRPIYGGTFKQDNVLFVLPQRPSQAELGSAAAIAAKLGQSVGRQLVISATSDISLTQELAANSHVFIVGTPDNNLLISELNADGLLPVRVKPGEAQLTIQGPERFPRDGVLSYTVAVTNSTTTPLNAPALEVILPPETPPLACGPDCELDKSGSFRRLLPPLKAGQTTLVTFTLTLSRQVPLPTVDATVALVEPQREPLNAVTWSTVVTGSVSPAGRAAAPRHLFVHSGRAVPEVDGVVQEIVSPWDPTGVAVVVSGATAEGLSKAGQALSTETYFPGMAGQVALVREVKKLPPARLLPRADFTLADLDYNDRTVNGFGAKETEFWFKVPFGWTLTDDANAVIKFRHSTVMGVREATLTALINGAPVGGVKLDGSNEKQGLLIVPLPASHIYGGENRLTLISDYEPTDWCVDNQSRAVWLTVLASSEFHLSHLVETPELDLGDFPLPYILTPDLSDLLFALPGQPGAAESMATLRLSVALGNAADGDGFSPEVILSEPGKEAVSGKHVIAIGRPSDNPTILQLNDVLPQPFIQGTDRPLQTIDAVIFRIPPGAEVGYIEQLPSIWDPAKGVLIVTGTGDEEIGWAAAALTNREALSGQLRGNLAAVRGTEVHSFDTRRSPGEEIVPTPPVTATLPITVTPSPTVEKATPTPKATATPTPFPLETEAASAAVSQFPFDSERTWLGLAIIALLLLGGVAVGVVWWRKRKGRYW
jgi:hypothetical protein